MLDWLTSKLRKDKDAHPFQKDKGIDEALKALPGNQPLIVLAEIGHWFADAESLKADLDARSFVNAICRLDEHARAALGEAWFRLFSEIATEGVQEDAWLALATYFGHAANAYCMAIEVLSLAQKPADSEKGLFALLTMRAICALASRKKLLRLRYRYPDAGYWKRLHELVAFGRAHAINHLQLKPYPEEESATPLSEFLRALLLEMAPLENLSPQQIACADLIIRKHQKDILFREEAGTPVPFYIDIAADSGPVRSPPADPRPESGRFFGAGSMPAHVFAIGRNIERSKTVPGWLAVTGCSAEEVQALCRSLGEHWSGNPPQRRHARRQAEAMIYVVHGFAQVRRMVAASSFARSGKKIGYKSYIEMMQLHESKFGQAAGAKASPPPEEVPHSRMDVLRQLELAGDRQLMEDWFLLDISEAGMGAVVPHYKRWLHIGVIVGFRPEESLDWRVGIIRRLGRSSQGRRQAGVEVWSGTPVSAQYRKLGESQAGPWVYVPEAMGSGLHDAILVSRIHRTMILERHNFEEGKPFRLLIDGEPSFHRFSRLLDHGRDFEYVEYEDMHAPPEG